MSRLLRIAQREYLSYLKTPGFWISLLVAPLLIAFMALGGPKALQSAAPPLRLSVVDLAHSGFQEAVQPMLGGRSPLAVLVAPPPQALAAATPQQASAALQPELATRRGERAPIELAVVVSGKPTDLKLDIHGAADTGMVNLLQNVAGDVMRQARLAKAGLPSAFLHTLETAAPRVDRYAAAAPQRPAQASDQEPVLVASGSAFLLWMMVITSAGILLNSVIEEKSGHILEVLMTSASIPEILGGKIAGVAGLSATVLAVWGGVGAALFVHAAPGQLAPLLSGVFAHGLMVYFVLFFLAGYLMYASVFAALGSFFESVREAQTIVGPMMILVSVPVLFLSLAVERPDTPAVVLLSWIPPFTPFLMTARIAAGLPAWQIGLALLMMVGTTAGVIWLCARAFAAGALSGGRPDLRVLVGALRRRPA